MVTASPRSKSCATSQSSGTKVPVTGLHEGSGAVGRPVHNVLRRQMLQRIRLVFGERLAH